MKRTEVETKTRSKEEVKQAMYQTIIQNLKNIKEIKYCAVWIGHTCITLHNINHSDLYIHCDQSFMENKCQDEEFIINIMQVNIKESVIMEISKMLFYVYFRNIEHRQLFLGNDFLADYVQEEK